MRHLRPHILDDGAIETSISSEKLETRYRCIVATVEGLILSIKESLFCTFHKGSSAFSFESYV